MKRFLIIMTALSILSGNTLSQTIPGLNPPDSILNLLDKTQSDTMKIILLNEYARQCFFTNRITEGFKHLEQANALAKEIKYKKAEGHYWMSLAKFHGRTDLGMYYHHLSEWANNEKLLSIWGRYPETPKRYGTSDTFLDSLESALSFFVKEQYLEVNGHINYRLNRWTEAQQQFLKLSLPFPLAAVYFGRMRYSENREKKKDAEQDLIALIEESNDQRFKAMIAYELGSYYFFNDQFNLAIEYFLKNNAIAKKLEDPSVEKANLIGAAYFLLGDEEKGLEYYLRALEIDSILWSQNNITDSALESSIGYHLINTTHMLIALGRYTEAKRYHELTKVHCDKYPISEYPGRYFLSKARILKSENKPEEALLYSRKAFQALEDNGLYYFSPDAAHEIALYFLESNQLDSALYYAHIEYNASTKSLFKYHLINASRFVSNLYERAGETNKSNEFLKIHLEHRDSLAEENSRKRIEEAEIRFFLKEKEQEVSELDAIRLLNLKERRGQQLLILSISAALIFILVIAFILYRNGRIRSKANRLLKNQKLNLETTLDKLKSTQSQLIHSEKMASLGELTAGIAHEIQNPLNFVNNFSEVNREMLHELKEAVAKNDQEEINGILKDLDENEEKITHHGKRAEGIVKSMLQHSRTGSDEKELTDINALCDEYLRLAYHGFRAKDKSFNSEFELDLDESLPKINVVPQDIGRVLLNLINNAFQAVSTFAEASADTVHKPLVTISTKGIPQPESSDRPLEKGESPIKGGKGGVTISITDNGPGIPDDIKDKIFEPFFTTKPTGEGTGLGLSMSYDIVTKGHGGTLEVESIDGEGSCFTIYLVR